MVFKSRAIPKEEWERHKEVIKDLFAQKNLVEVIEEMKQGYRFDATQVKTVQTFPCPPF
jgi:hypothetical protein